jgi:hypothetical protein
VTVGALNDGVSPKLAEALDGQHLVDHSRTEQNATRIDGVRPSRDAKGPFGSADAADEDVLHAYVWILIQLLAGGTPELIGRGTISRDEVVHVHRSSVSAWAGVAQQHLLAGPPERQGGGEASGASSNDHDIIRHAVSPSVRVSAAIREAAQPGTTTVAPRAAPACSQSRRVNRRTSNLLAIL